MYISVVAAFIVDNYQELALVRRLCVHKSKVHKRSLIIQSMYINKPQTLYTSHLIKVDVKSLTLSSMNYVINI